MKGKVDGMAVPIQAEFADDTYEALQQLAWRKGKQLGEMQRDVIALAKWIQDTRDAGARIVVERGGKITEMIRN